MSRDQTGRLEPNAAAGEVGEGERMGRGGCVCMCVGWFSWKRRTGRALLSTQQYAKQQKCKFYSFIDSVFKIVEENSVANDLKSPK